MVIAGISSIFFKWTFPGTWYILLATLLALGIGLMAETAGTKAKVLTVRENETGYSLAYIRDGDCDLYPSFYSHGLLFPMD